MATAIASPEVTTADFQHIDYSTPAREQQKSKYLVGSWFDLIFICNLYWPLILLIDGWGGLRAHESLLFWQVFFVTTPHRWITLFLVFGDRDKYTQGINKYLIVTLLIVGSMSLLWLSVGSLLCLMAVDYVWNAWHFAAQHHGIYRIYSRGQTSGKSIWPHAEKWLFRSFILYVIARVAGWSWSTDRNSDWLSQLDYFMLAIPILVVIPQWITSIGSRWKESWTGALYTTSVMTLFSCLLLAVHIQSEKLVLQLALASALFHAVEYLGIVSWSMQSTRVVNRKDLFGYVGSRWIGYLMVFVIVLGAGAWAMEHGAVKLWAAINLMVAFLHYSFDGMIWKKPRQKKAL
ncbi:hypothetical protein [Rubinisphaera sp.]|uniref:hypothetical protein n=1 Tax=Rubinisphaera sp. TaxID=2024857 RepID=UPI000C11A29E|nr:hypothetical protein [Rubinisphaera sp.]MBV11585.1 hypothetical protein [Rubinisphaera sp.]HCS54003.1 hypothetical protein [Planctomycetaceae bacterium]|tara:strand:+ start:1778 stop:2818 length:1041 start_codon:yes stop_codon:yes gene_type:complete